MHRHGYKGTKFGRQRDQRNALLKSLADSLVLQEAIETTLPKAKAVASYTEKLVSKAKKGKDNLHARRQVISGLVTLEAAHKLVDELGPKLGGRNSGYLRVERTVLRRGDGAQLARISFVDEFKTDKASKPKSSSQETAKKTEQKEEQATGRADIPKPTSSSNKMTQPKSNATPKRSGIRGNR